MRKAFTLVEVVLALAVLGILLGIAVPRLTGVLDRIQVDAAAAQLLAAHQRARFMAITRNEVLVLSVEPAGLAIARSMGGAPIWQEVGPAASGVTLGGPLRRFTFSPEGLSLGLSNATLELSRGEAHRTVVVSRLGRTRLVR